VREEESAHRGAESCHYGGGKIPIGTTLSLWRNPPMGEQRAATIWRRKDTHRDNPVTMEERKSLMGEQATAAIQGRNCNCQGSIGLNLAAV
jgi:hypothetical protein